MRFSLLCYFARGVRARPARARCSLCMLLLLGEEMRIFVSKWEKEEAGQQGVGEEVSGWIAKFAG